MATPLKAALEDLLRARRLRSDAPPLQGEDRRFSPLPTGISSIDALLGGGFPRGQVSEVYGPVSSGRTGLVDALVTRTTRGGGLAAWMDPGDRLDPATAAWAGVDLTRLLWLRGGRPFSKVLSALGTLLGSGLFDVVVLDIAGMPRREVCVPQATWIRLARTIEATPTALVLLANEHLSRSPRGVSWALFAAQPRWSGGPGPGRLFQGLEVEAGAGHHASHRVRFALQAVR